MNFDRSRGGAQRSDYEQFATFLGLNKNARREDVSEQVCPITPTCKSEKALAMVYAPKQMWCGIYEPDVALVNGTLFEELNKPFYMSGCSTKCKEGCL